MGLGRRVTRRERQARLGTLEGLDLAFLVAAKHQGAFGRIRA